MPVNWNPELFKTGLEDIDIQHQGLFDALNKLYDAYREKKEDAEVVNIMGFLGDYVVRHFSYEESLMRKHAYPGLERQTYEHNAFVQNFREMKGMLEKEGPNKKLMLRIYNDVYKWLVEHISNLDREMGQYIAGK